MFCAVWSWSALSTKSYYVVIGKERVNWLETTVELEENAENATWLAAFSPVPTIVSKSVFLKIIKNQDCV